MRSRSCLNNGQLFALQLVKAQNALVIVGHQGQYNSKGLRNLFLQILFQKHFKCISTVDFKIDHYTRHRIFTKKERKGQAHVHDGE